MQKHWSDNVRIEAADIVLGGNGEGQSVLLRKGDSIAGRVRQRQVAETLLLDIGAATYRLAAKRSQGPLSGDVFCLKCPKCKAWRKRLFYKEIQNTIYSAKFECLDCLTGVSRSNKSQKKGRRSGF